MNPGYFLTRMITFISASLRLPIFYLKCFRNKNEALFFNHTDRTAQIQNAQLPLYANPKYVPQNSLILDSRVMPYHGGSQYVSYEVLTHTATFAGNIIGLFKQNTDKMTHISTAKQFLFKVLYKITKPNCVYILVWYREPDALLAAKACGIKTIELQHGLIYTTHIYYNLESTFCKQLSPLSIVDEIWVYGSYWKDTLVAMNYPGNQIKIVGYYLNLPPKSTTVKSNRQVVYMSQPGFEAIVISHIQSIYSQATHAGIKLLVALHPQDQIAQYSALEALPVELCQGQTYDLIQTSGMVVSVFSTTLWEALLYNTCPFILQSDALSSVMGLEDLLSLGAARLLSNGMLPEPFPMQAGICAQFFEEPQRFEALL